MRRFSFWLILLALFALPAVAETFDDVAVVDSNCASKVAANPDAHTRDCALKCAASGYGILDQGAEVLKV